MPKGTCRAEATSNIEKIKPVALAVTELRLSEGISQSVAYLISQQKIPLNKLFFKFRSNLLKLFQVDLKACLGLVLPNQYCLIIIRGNRGCFFGDIILSATPTPLWSLLYTTIIVYDIFKKYTTVSCMCLFKKKCRTRHGKL